MRAYTRIRVAREGKVESVTLAYPERRNAIGPTMTNELLWALHDAREADEVRVIVLTGDEGSFCSGGDFAEILAGAPPSELPPKGDFTDLLLALWRSDKPVVAK